MNKIDMTLEMLEDIMKLSSHNIRIVGITMDESTKVITLLTEGSGYDSEYLKLRYTRPYDVNGGVPQLRQDVVLTVLPR